MRVFIGVDECPSPKTHEAGFIFRKEVEIIKLDANK